jgi:8-oxo-dGTP pyrophosphatase MutT (NUDIX family)
MLRTTPGAEGARMGAPAQVDYFISYTSTDVDYHPSKPHGQAIASDRHFTLLADDDGVGFVHCDDGVLVVPLDEGGNVLLALERSVAFDREVLVLAGGTVEPGEPLQQTANRELQEELGWHADQLVFLGELHPFKYLTSRQFVFLARELTPSNRPGDERHPIGTRTVPLASFTSQPVWRRSGRHHCGSDRQRARCRHRPIHLPG